MAWERNVTAGLDSCQVKKRDGDQDHRYVRSGGNGKNPKRGCCVDHSLLVLHICVEH